MQKLCTNKIKIAIFLAWCGVIICSFYRMFLNPNWEAAIGTSLVGAAHFFYMRRLDPRIITKHVVGDIFMVVCFYFMLDSIWKNWPACICNGLCCLALFLTSFPEMEVKKEKGL